MGFGHNQRGSHRETFDLREGGTVVSDDMTRFVAPGEPDVGWVVRTGRIPLGYFDDARRHPQDVPGGRGAAGGGVGRPRLARGRRHAAAVRPRLAGGQHRRREGLRRGGRGGAAGPCPGWPTRWSSAATASGGGRRSSRSSRPSPDVDVDSESLHAACVEKLARFKAPEGVHLRREGAQARQRQGRLPVGEKPSDATGSLT